jgi:hypothetical protein
MWRWFAWYGTLLRAWGYFVLCVCFSPSALFVEKLFPISSPRAVTLWKFRAIEDGTAPPVHICDRAAAGGKRPAAAAAHAWCRGTRRDEGLSRLLPVSCGRAHGRHRPGPCAAAVDQCRGAAGLPGPLSEGRHRADGHWHSRIHRPRLVWFMHARRGRALNFDNDELHVRGGGVPVHLSRSPVGGEMESWRWR